MARTQAVFYRDERGAEPADEFIEALPPKHAAKIDDYIEEHLNGRRPDEPPPEHPISSQLDGELRELRVRFANTRYRILYQRSDNLVVLLHAIEKDTGAVPAADIELGKRRLGSEVGVPTAGSATRVGASSGIDYCCLPRAHRTTVPRAPRRERGCPRTRAHSSRVVPSSEAPARVAWEAEP